MWTIFYRGVYKGNTWKVFLSKTIWSKNNCTGGRAFSGCVDWRHAKKKMPRGCIAHLTNIFITFTEDLRNVYVNICNPFRPYHTTGQQLPTKSPKPSLEYHIPHILHDNWSNIQSYIKCRMELYWGRSLFLHKIYREKLSNSSFAFGTQCQNVSLFWKNLQKWTDIFSYLISETYTQHS